MLARDVYANRCREDGWSAPLRRCLAEPGAVCDAQWTPYQRDALSAALAAARLHWPSECLEWALVLARFAQCKEAPELQERWAATTELASDVVAGPERDELAAHCGTEASFARDVCE